jgi:soluble lytic murein transglycosylase-like protein
MTDRLRARTENWGSEPSPARRHLPLDRIAGGWTKGLLGLLLLLLFLLPRPGPAQERCAPPVGYEIPAPGKISASNRERLAVHITRVAAKYRLEPALVHAVITAESGYNPIAVSEDGAVGLMQVLSDTADDYADSDLCDPLQNIEVGTRHLSRLLYEYRNISHALAAYNAGEGTMKRQRRAVTYLETRKYVIRVIDYYQRYRGRLD